MTDEQISGSLMPQTNPVGVRRRRLGDIFSIQEKVPGGVRGSEFKIFYRKSYLETWEAQRLGYFIQNFPGDLETRWQRKGRRAKVACGSFESRHCQSHLEPAFSQGIEIFLTYRR